MQKFATGVVLNCSISIISAEDFIMTSSLGFKINVKLLLSIIFNKIGTAHLMLCISICLNT